MEIWLARHGATAWSRSGQHTGITDLPLISEGVEEARALGERLAGHEFGRVLSSPMERARETARLAGFGDRIEVTDLLKEADYGEYEGLTSRQIHEDRPGWEVFEHGSPGGETPRQIADRAERLLQFIGEPGGDVLCFAHGHILRSLSILGHEHDHRALVLWNEVR
jgi:broad specificity phosphatase PhoE